MSNNGKAPKFELSTVPTSSLQPHPRNYRKHPDDQIEHLVQSIEEHGFYRNIVITKHGTILAGHGVWQAVCRMGLSEIPVIVLDLDDDDPKALKVLAGDNEIGHLGEIDDRALTDLLKDVSTNDDVGLLGTGFDEQMLANLLFVTRPASEIADFDEAAEWVGMPEYERANDPLKMTVSFATNEDRLAFGRKLGYKMTDKTKSVWWPPREKDDVESIRFVSE